MSVFGTPYMSIYAPDNISLAINRGAGQAIPVMSCTSDVGVGGSASATFSLGHLNDTMPWTMADGTTSYPSIRQGDIAVVYVHDSIAAANLRVACFVIETVKLENSSMAAPTVTLSGPDETKELDYLLNFQNIGVEFSTTSLQVEAGGSANSDIIPASIGSVSTTLVQTWHPGETTMKVADNDGFSVGDPIAIDMSGARDGEGNAVPDKVLHATVMEVGVESGSGYDYIKVEVTPPYHVPNGSKLCIPEVFKDSTIKLTLNTSPVTYHIARVSEEPEFGKIAFDAPIPDGVSSAAGAAVKIITGLTAAASGNITQIMNFATSFYVGSSTAYRWTLASGSESSDPVTSHVSDGASTLRLLNDAAGASGNVFRVKFSSATAPSRQIEWVSTPGASGVTLVMPSTGAQAKYEDTSYAVMHSIEREGNRVRRTRVTPSGGDNSFNLGDRTIEPSAGYTVAYKNGAWIMYHDAGAAEAMLWQKVSFDEIVPVVNVLAERQIAADKLVTATEKWLERQNAGTNGKGVDRFYLCDCIWHGEPKIGDLVTMKFATGEWDSDEVDVYISSISHSITSSGPFAGARVTHLELSEDTVIKRLSGIDSLINGVSSSSGSSSGGVYSTGGGGSTATAKYIAGDNIRLGGGAINLTDTVRIRKALYVGGPETNDSRIYLYDRESGRYREVLIVHSEYGTTSGYPFLRFA